MDGSAFRGLGTVFAVGVAAIQALWLSVPPAIVAGLYWLLAPRFGWEFPALAVLAVVAIVWCALNVLWFVYAWVSGFIRGWLNRSRHAEFMRLRARFYGPREICLETLDSLRARAKAADA